MSTRSTASGSPAMVRGDGGGAVVETQCAPAPVRGGEQADAAGGKLAREGAEGVRGAERAVQRDDDARL